jgi:hypothetical protein
MITASNALYKKAQTEPSFLLARDEKSAAVFQMWQEGLITGSPFAPELTEAGVQFMLEHSDMNTPEEVAAWMGSEEEQ